MQKEYLLQGLDCANCAAKIENAVKNQSRTQREYKKENDWLPGRREYQVTSRIYCRV